ncbi:MAG: glycosyltransferase [Chloroflexi bacterium]|nr:glycosyltransferase [Chloroflexota bacterium]MDL1943974.1 glycosyltransferase family 1 protein [Chloroflexi bacterium CFX2]
MRIVIVAPGSRGDVQPYIALGKGLQNAGHFIRLVSHSNFESLVASHGLEFWSFGNDVKNAVENGEIRELTEKGNFLLLMAKMAKEAEREALRFAEGGLRAAQGMDLVLSGIGGLFIGTAIAEKLDIPFIQAYVFPFTPTKEFSSVLTPKIPPLFNRFSHHLARQLMWQGFRSADTMARKKALNIPTSSLLGPYHSRSTHNMPILYGFSPSVIPAPSDWTGDIHITGYWFTDEGENWRPPAALLDFLQSGSAPLYIGFGSMSNRNPEQTADLVIQALAQTNQRAILLSGWGGLQKANIPDSIFMIDSIPHSWLFPRVSAVIHHGGASTTAAGLKAGVPSIVIPFFGDQPFWGQRIADLGVGPKPIPRKKLTAERLANAINEALTNEGIRQRASKLGRQIQTENGIESAVEIINKLEKRKAA